MSSTPAWVAIAGFGLSIASLGWQGVREFRRRPRLRVGINRDIATQAVFDTGRAIDTTLDRVDYRITVLNAGAEATTVYDVGLFTADARLSIRALPRARTKNAARRLTSFEEQWEGPFLPAEVPARGVLEWRIFDAVTRPYTDEPSWFAFVEEYRPNRPPRMSRSRISAPRA